MVTDQQQFEPQGPSQFNENRIGWGILGAGHISSVFAQDLAILPDEARLVAVGSRALNKATTFARDYGFARSYDSYAELVDDDEVDVVYIGTPHNDHYASAKLCLEAGKSVLVEKPLTVSAAEADELIALAQDRQLFLMEAMWTRTNPLIRKAAEIIKSGELGQLRHASASFGFAFAGEESHRLLNPDLAGGAILDLGVYPIHAVNLFLGEPADLAAFGHFATTGVDAHTAAVLNYPATEDRPAATASVLCSLEVTPAAVLELLCTEGKIIIDFFLRPDEIKVYRGHDHEIPPEVMITQLPGKGYTFQAQEVMHCLRTKKIQSDLVPWADSQATMRTLDRWRAALAEQRS